MDAADGVEGGESEVAGLDRLLQGNGLENRGLRIFGNSPSATRVHFFPSRLTSYR